MTKKKIHKIFWQPRSFHFISELFNQGKTVCNTGTFFIMTTEDSYAIGPFSVHKEKMQVAINPSRQCLLSYMALAVRNWNFFTRPATRFVLSDAVERQNSRCLRLQLRKERSKQKTNTTWKHVLICRDPVRWKTFYSGNFPSSALLSFLPSRRALELCFFKHARLMRK